MEDKWHTESLSVLYIHTCALYKYFTGQAILQNHDIGEVSTHQNKSSQHIPSINFAQLLQTINFVAFKKV